MRLSLPLIIVLVIIAFLLGSATRVLVEGGVEVRYKPFDMTIDLTWLAILYPTLLALFGVILLSRKLRTHPHTEPPKKKAVKL